jgi:hypothetical protein
MSLEELQEILRVGESVPLTKRPAVAVYCFRPTMCASHRPRQDRQLTL